MRWVIASPDKSLVFEDEITTAQKYVDILKNTMQCDVVIVLGHLGDVLEEVSQNTSIKLAEAVSGIDIIVDGHAHTKMEEPLVVNGTYIVSANEWGKFVGDDCSVLAAFICVRNASIRIVGRRIHSHKCLV